ncbi:MAG: hypothetical protein WA854_13810 [Candidatus Binataceae bacterium]
MNTRDSLTAAIAVSFLFGAAAWTGCTRGTNSAAPQMTRRGPD